MIRIVLDIARNDPTALGGVIASLGNKLDVSEEHARKLIELDETEKEMKCRFHTFETH